MKSVEKSIGVASAERFLRIIAALTDGDEIMRGAVAPVKTAYLVF